MLYFTLVVSLLFANYNLNFVSSKPLVTLNLGQIRGIFMKTLTGKQFSAFRGIPYAKPPTGNLRFRPPEKLTDPWISQPFDATKNGVPCTQYDLVTRKVIGREDCLFLNVYVPQVSYDGSKINDKPVMVFIHGGGFNFGEGSTHIYGPRRLLDHNIILVTINYRLNVLGFLSTGNEASLGNYGLLDQVEALKWIQENIKAFGGDPERVTILGQSAGGASVSYHMLSHLSTGLFSGAIVMSGSTLSPWAYDYNPVRLAKKLAGKIGCAKRNSVEIVNCLRKLPIESFSKPLEEIGDNFMYPFRPTLDGNFLTDHPLNLIVKDDIANRVPLMLGITPSEGVNFYGLAFGNFIPELSDESIQIIIEIAEDVDEDMGESAVKLVKQRYFRGMEEYTPQIFQNKLIKVMGDCTVDAPFYHNLELYVKLGIEPYVYSYDYVTNHSCAKIFGFDESGKPTHADDLYFVFDSRLLFPRDYERISDVNEDKFLKLFINFAKYRNPNLISEDKAVEWLPAQKNHLQIYHLDDPLELRELKIDPELIDFWMTQVPGVLGLKKVIKDEL